MKLKLTILVTAMAGMSVGLAAPASAGCQTQAFAQYCDGPVPPDGTWDRCQWTFQAGVPSTYRCYPIDPAQPWPMFPLGQPQYHIYP
jgi:hypothetical protein